MTRGDVYRLTSPRGARGAEQQGVRYGVVVQSDELFALNTVLVAPTSRSALRRSFRPTVELRGTSTQVLVDQTTAIAPERFGDFAGRLTGPEMQAIDDALRAVFDL